MIDAEIGYDYNDCIIKTDKGAFAAKYRIVEKTSTATTTDYKVEVAVELKSGIKQIIRFKGNAATDFLKDIGAL